jgi:hypothetical protein
MSNNGHGLRRTTALLGVLALVLMAVFLPSVKADAASNAASNITSHAPSTVQVFVGYADNLRANPTNFPTPWAGAPGVTIDGCTGCTYDSGAIRIVNNSPLPVSVGSVSAKVGPCTFSLWHSHSIPANGGQLILTQLDANFANNCTPSGTTFDSSDIGTLPGCPSQDGIIPEVDATIDGVAQTFTDSGQVLNTSGYDKACQGNESTQWTQIGSAPCPGAILSLAPPSQTADVGSTATVQATLTNTCGTALQGASIHFAASGANSASGDAATDINGLASFSYSGSVLGSDSVLATTTNPAGTITSNTVTVTWVKRASAVTITGSGTSDFDDPATVSAVLTDGSGPIAGQTVAFTLNGAQTCSGTTDTTGMASCSITPGEAAGAYTLTASFGGDASDLASSASGAFTVTHEETSLVYTGSTKAANGQPFTMSGTLTEDGARPIANRTVTFTLGSASAQSCSGITDNTGAAACTIASVNQPSSTTSVPASAVFAGDAYYLPATAATVTVGFTYMTGDAYGIASSGLVGISKTPEAGPVQTATAEHVAPPCVVTISGLISAGTLCASVDTTVNPGASTANASVQNAHIGVLGLPVINIGAVTSTSKSMCTGSTGEATVASISVGGIPLNINLHPGPNTKISILGITITLNEQIQGPGTLTVNAVHIQALGLLDVVLASSTSDIHNC